MTRASDLIRYLEAEDCLPDAGNGILNIKNGSRLSGEIVDEIKQHKEMILAILERDRQAQAVGLNVAVYGELYWLSITPQASVYVERTGGAQGEWSMWKENDKAMYRNYDVKATGTFDEVLSRASNYIQFLRRKHHEEERASGRYSTA